MSQVSGTIEQGSRFSQRFDIWKTIECCHTIVNSNFNIDWSFKWTYTTFEFSDTTIRFGAGNVILAATKLKNRKKQTENWGKTQTLFVESVTHNTAIDFEIKRRRRRKKREFPQTHCGCMRHYCASHARLRLVHVHHALMTEVLN